MPRLNFCYTNECTCSYVCINVKLICSRMQIDVEADATQLDSKLKSKYFGYAHVIPACQTLTNTLTELPLVREKSAKFKVREM